MGVPPPSLASISVMPPPQLQGSSASMVVQNPPPIVSTSTVSYFSDWIKILALLEPTPPKNLSDFFFLFCLRKFQ
jgi:hypothetical protein